VQAAAERCELLWLVDGRLPEVADMVALLGRYGTVVDIGGMSTREAASIIASHRPDGLVSYFDAGMVAMAEVAEQLGLPFHSPTTAAVLVDKLSQRAALAAAGLAVPRCSPLPPGSPTEVIAGLPEDTRWPAVLKPRTESGSRHTFLVRDIEALVDLLDGLGDDHEEMVLEDYLEGAKVPGTAPFADYLSVETAVSDGRLSHLALTGRFPPAPDFRETGFFVPASVDDTTRDAVLALAGEATTALKVQTGFLHTEIKLTPDGPRVLEVNGRIGGGLPDLLQQAAGFDLLEWTLRSALGESLAVPAPLLCARIGYRLFLQAPPLVGTVEGIDGLAALADQRGVDNITIHRGPGSAVDWREGSRDFIIAVVGSVSDYSSLLAIERLMHRVVRVNYRRET
jgi:biotin carboxylase